MAHLLARRGIDDTLQFVGRLRHHLHRIATAQQIDQLATISVRVCQFESGLLCHSVSPLAAPAVRSARTALGS